MHYALNIELIASLVEDRAGMVNACLLAGAAVSTGVNPFRNNEVLVCELDRPYPLPMILTLNLPDAPALRHVSEAEMRLELACALHAQGRVSKTTGAEMAGVDLFAFQEALGERQISTYTVDDLHEEVDALRSMFPAQTLPPAK